MKQVYVLLAKTKTVTSRIVHTFTHGTYTHASLALTPETNKFYSYAAYKKVVEPAAGVAVKFICFGSER